MLTNEPLSGMCEDEMSFSYSKRSKTPPVQNPSPPSNHYSPLPPQQQQEQRHEQQHEQQHEDLRNDKLYVTHLPMNFQKRDLDHLFGGYGQLANIEVKHGGYAFIQYIHPSDAQEAIHGLHNHLLQNKRLTVEFSNKRNINGNTTTTATTSSSGNNDLCLICNLKGHWARECPESKELGLDVKSGKCFKCGLQGHLARFCHQYSHNTGPEKRSPNHESSVQPTSANDQHSRSDQLNRSDQYTSRNNQYSRDDQYSRGGCDRLPLYAERAYPERPYPERPYPERAYSDRSYTERGYPERSYSVRGPPERYYPERAYVDRSYPDRYYSDRPREEERPYAVSFRDEERVRMERSRFEDRSYAGRPREDGRMYRDRGYDDMAHPDRSHLDRQHEFYQSHGSQDYYPRQIIDSRDPGSMDDRRIGGRSGEREYFDGRDGNRDEFVRDGGAGYVTGNGNGNGNGYGSENGGDARHDAYLER